MENRKIINFIEEYRKENHISPFRSDDEFWEYVIDGVEDINGVCGTKIDYEKDRKARRLLKNYVLYADYKKLAEFKQLYVGEYDALQRAYYVKNNTSNVQ